MNCVYSLTDQQTIPCFTSPSSCSCWRNSERGSLTATHVGSKRLTGCTSRGKYFAELKQQGRKLSFLTVLIWWIAFLLNCNCFHVSQFPFCTPPPPPPHPQSSPHSSSFPAKPWGSNDSSRTCHNLDFKTKLSSEAILRIRKNSQLPFHNLNSQYVEPLANLSYICSPFELSGVKCKCTRIWKVAGGLNIFISNVPKFNMRLKWDPFSFQKHPTSCSKRRKEEEAVSTGILLATTLDTGTTPHLEP